MGNNTQKMREVIFSKGHLTSYNIVNVCKNTILNVDKDLHNYNDANLPG